MQDLIDFFKNKKNVINTLVLAILVVAIPLGIKLARERNLFFSRADVIPIALSDGECVKDKANNKIICGKVPLTLISPDGDFFTSQAPPAPLSCTTTATNKSARVNSSTSVAWTYNYPAPTRIRYVTIPAVSGVRFTVGAQKSEFGQELKVVIPRGTLSLQIIAETQQPCQSFTAPFTMQNNCGQQMPDFISMGSSGAWTQAGVTCQAVSPTPPPGSVTGSGDFRLTGQSSCQSGSPVIDLTWDRSDGGEYTIEKSPNPIPNQIPGQLTTRPLLTPPYVTTNATYQLRIISTTGRRSDELTVSTPSSCPTSLLFNVFQLRRNV